MLLAVRRISPASPASRVCGYAARCAAPARCCWALLDIVNTFSPLSISPPIGLSAMREASGVRRLSGRRMHDVSPGAMAQRVERGSIGTARSLPARPAGTRSGLMQTFAGRGGLAAGRSSAIAAPVWPCAASQVTCSWIISVCSLGTAGLPVRQVSPRRQSPPGIVRRNW